jgi:hypothetical protein
MLPAELVDVRRVAGVDATVRSLAAVEVVLLSAMAGSWSSLCIVALPVAEAKLHRAWSYSTIPTCERRSTDFRPAGAVARLHLPPRALPASSGLEASCVPIACARFLSDDKVGRQMKSTVLCHDLCCTCTLCAAGRLRACQCTRLETSQ